MSQPAPIRRSTGLWPVWLRSEISREHARAYWRGPHAVLAGRIPGIDEYRQHHFAADGHGFWPSLGDVSTELPSDWRMGGAPEVAFADALGPLRGLGRASWTVLHDEANVFERVLAQPTGPAGGRWFRSGHDAGAVARAVVFLRRRPDAGMRAFRRFVHGALGPALDRAPGVLELRTHVFLPYAAALWPSPGVAHDNPPHRRYHAAIVIGAADRPALDALLTSAEVAATQPGQAEHCLALHAYAVEETVAVVRGGRAL